MTSWKYKQTLDPNEPIRKVRVVIEFYLTPGEEDYTRVAHLQLHNPKNKHSQQARLKTELFIIDEQIEWLDDSPEAIVCRHKAEETD